MNDLIITSTTWLATISLGMMAGIYFAFSTFLMRSLDQLAPQEAINAMNAINHIIVKSPFLALFWGTSLAAILLVAQSLPSGNALAQQLSFIGGVTYIAGMGLITITRNVPLNEMLAGFDASRDDAGQTWNTYLKLWGFWNHIRSASSMLATACYASVILVGY